MEEVNLKEIGGRIRRQRVYFGYTREALSEKLGVTPKFCSDIESGLKGMSLQTLCSLSRVLKLPTDYILFGETAGAESTAISAMLSRFPAEKLKYAEELLRIFILSVDNT